MNWGKKALYKQNKKKEIGAPIKTACTKPLQRGTCDFFATLFGNTVPRTTFIAEIALQIQRCNAFAQLSALHILGVVMFNATPKGQFQLSQFDELIVVVSLKCKNNVQYDVVVFI